MASEPSFLNSWEEIVAYLHCGVRTVQRWEAHLGLPVVRPRQKAHSPVLAARADIDGRVKLRSGNDQSQIPVEAKAALAPSFPLQFLNTGIDLGMTFATMALSTNPRGRARSQRLRARATHIHRLVLRTLDRSQLNQQDARSAQVRLRNLELILQEFGDEVN
jgi:hypothetical protein